MDLLTHKKTITVLSRIFDAAREPLPLIPTLVQKPRFIEKPSVMQPFERVTPEERGISSEYIYNFVSELNSSETLDMHTLLIICKNAVIAEGCFGAYKLTLPHLVFSAAKSVTQLAIGLLIDEKRLTLDSKLVDIFNLRALKLSRITNSGLTVRHLLTMTSGAVFNEAGFATETDWVRCFFESSKQNEPGEVFRYNSMNTYMLSAIVKHITGMGLVEYLTDKLFLPLGITDVFWEKCPNGIEKGGWGLYARLEDMAKLGQLFLNGGTWNGKRIISKQWVKRSTTKRVNVHQGDYNYGYQIWCCKNNNSFTFNGMFDQNVLCFPNSGIIVACNAGTSTMFQQSDFFKLSQKYFGDFTPADSLERDDRSAASLNRLLSSLGTERGCYKKSDVDFRNMLIGNTYTVSPKNYILLPGLVPLITQATQNNYSPKVEKISFESQSDKFVMSVTQGQTVYRFNIGIDCTEYTEAEFGGEWYHVASKGKFSLNEDDIPVLSIRLSFLEIPNTRLIKIFIYNDKVSVRFYEQPGKEFICDMVDSVKQEIKEGTLLNGLLSGMGMDYIRFKASTAFERELIMIPNGENTDEKNSGV